VHADRLIYPEENCEREKVRHKYIRTLRDGKGGWPRAEGMLCVEKRGFDTVVNLKRYCKFEALISVLNN
jgi:hypothetical protein